MNRNIDRQIANEREVIELIKQMSRKASKYINAIDTRTDTYNEQMYEYR